MHPRASWYHIRTRPKVYSNVSSSLHLKMAPRTRFSSLVWWSRLTGRKWHGFGLYLLFITAAFLRGTRGRIWCLCVIVLTPSHILSPVHLLSPLLICAVCLQISDILLRLGSGVPALPARRQRDPRCIPWGASSIFSFLILLQFGLKTSPFCLIGPVHYRTERHRGSASSGSFFYNVRVFGGA